LREGLPAGTTEEALGAAGAKEATGTMMEATGIPKPTGTMEAIIPSTSLLRALERLHVSVRRSTRGVYAGNRRSQQKGSSLEFRDYRDYSPGDDLRVLDWRALARLGRPYVRQFEDEQELVIHILIDMSSSMDWGEPSKGLLAKRLAAALAYAGLTDQDRIGLGFIRGQQLEYIPPLTGRPAAWRLWKAIGEAPWAGETDLEGSVHSFSRRWQQPGLIWLISDFLSPSGQPGYEAALRRLQGLGQQVVVSHLLAPDEVDPSGVGEVEFEDVETGTTVNLNLTPRTLELYQANLEAFITGISSFCARRQIGYHLALSNTPLQDLVAKDLLMRGLLA